MEHEPHLAAVADRRAHAVRDPPRGTGDHRRLALRRIGGLDLGLLGDPGRSTPVDRRTLGSGALGDRRVGRRQPGRNRRGRPLLGPRQRLLRRHAPTSQVELHRRQAERLAEPLVDQVAHRLAGPQGERPLQVVEAPVAKPALDLAGLLGRQEPLATPRRHPPAVEHPVLALRTMALQPDVDRLPLHADHLRRLRLAQALLQDQEQRAATQLLLRRPADAAKVTRCHARSIAAPSCSRSVRGPDRARAAGRGAHPGRDPRLVALSLAAATAAVPPLGHSRWGARPMGGPHRGSAHLLARAIGSTASAGRQRRRDQRRWRTAPYARLARRYRRHSHFCPLTGNYASTAPDKPRAGRG